MNEAVNGATANLSSKTTGASGYLPAAVPAHLPCPGAPASVRTNHQPETELNIIMKNLVNSVLTHGRQTNLLRNGGVLAAAALLGLATGCAHAREKSATRHVLVHRAVVAPPGWTVTGINLTNSAAANGWGNFSVVAPGTNAAGWFASLLGARPRVYTDFAESWSDTSSGGGTFVFTDPTASAVHFGHTNQTALGGSRGTDIGSIQSVITTNAVNAITAGGSAVGSVIGAAVKAP